MGNTCCSGKDCMGQEIRCEVDVYQDRMGRKRDNGTSERKKPVQESVVINASQMTTMAPIENNNQ